MEQLGMNVTEADSQQQIFGVEYGSMMALVNQQTHTHQPLRAAFAAYSADSQPQQCFIPSAFNSSGTTRSTLPLQPKLEDPQNSASGIGIGQLVNAEFISEHSAAAAAAADCQDGRDKERSKAIDENDAIKSKIVSHVHYPRLVNAYLDCQKIGAPEDVIAELEEVHNKCQARQCSASLSVGMDPELDHFMEAYCELFVRYHEELSRPFKEATDFFRKIEMQLSSMTKGAIKTYSEGEGMGESASSEEEEEGEGSARERDIIDIHPHSHPHPHAEDRLLKQHLLRKYSGYLSGLKQEFLKKKKKGKLPKEARQKLMDWWSAHYKWPYPSEAQKIALAESTGLDQKQINNWFINQRKRHWKPSEEMQFVVMEPPPTHHHHHHHHNQLYHHHPSFSMDC